MPRTRFDLDAVIAKDSELEAVAERLRDFRAFEQQGERASIDFEQLRLSALSRSQAAAKASWCLRSIDAIQRHYLAAFQLIRDADYYEAWCELERCEIQLSHLDPHVPAQDVDPWGIEFVGTHIERWQSLFPYAVFVSPAFVIKRRSCGTCGAVVSLSEDCGHRVGEIYDGLMCYTTVEEMEVREISIVSDPHQKYSVMLPDKEQDRMSYALLRYVSRGLSSPWHEWEPERKTALHPHERYVHVPPSDPCPCESGQPYSDCCLARPGVIRPHYDIIFSHPVPEDLPRFEFA